MIVVVADDFTGAAEICGIALRYGLKVKLNTVVEQGDAAGTDVLVVATDTRSMPRAAAVAHMANITAAVAKLKPALFYKKLDSVLRGHVTAEIETHLQQLNLKRALVLPANPSLNRKIIQGQYLLNDAPLHTTAFAHDPEFPVSSSSVKHILKSSNIPVQVKSHVEGIKYDGLIIGNVADAADMDAWANKIDADTLPAGGADFFTVLLRKAGFTDAGVNNAGDTVWGQRALIVSGTAYAGSVAKISELEQSGAPVCYMPAGLVNKVSQINEEELDMWCETVINKLNLAPKAIVAINKPDVTIIDAAMLRRHMAMAVSNIIKNTSINELLIEGGSTAAAIFDQLGIKAFYPQAMLAPGVIRMATPDFKGLHITIKPGSYSWPQSIQAVTLY